MAVWTGERYEATFCNTKEEEESELLAMATAHRHDEHRREEDRWDRVREETERERERPSGCQTFCVEALRLRFPVVGCRVL